MPAPAFAGRTLGPASLQGKGGKIAKVLSECHGLAIWKHPAANLVPGVTELGCVEMAFVHPGDGALDYFPCHYGRSRLTFRGPSRDLSREYLVSLGSSETYGRFVVAPFPALLEENSESRRQPWHAECRADVYLGDRGAIEVAAGAHLAVLQVMGAQNMTNRYYTVHPRRNDRFVAATPLLRSMYRDVDFTEIHFTRHLIQTLWSRGPDRFAPIAAELKSLWVERMTAILLRLPARRILFWTADRPPPDTAGDPMQPLALVDRAMIEAIRPMPPPMSNTSPARGKGRRVRAMRFLPGEERAVHEVPNPAAHQEAAARLLPVIDGLL